MNDSQKERTFQYVPVTESIKCLFKNTSVQNEYASTKFPMYHGYRKQNSNHQDIFWDFTDGSAFKKNKFFIENKDALRLILYQDAFEVCNPLGAAKKKHKILAVYLQLANFRPHLRSNTDQMLLVLLCYESGFKDFGQKKIFHFLIDDLQNIEINGIDIGGSEPIKGGLFA